MAEIHAIEDIVGFRIRLAHGAVMRHFGEHFAELGLTQKQVSVLWLTHETPGIAQTDLARRLQMDRATTMSIVHSLERRGLIERGHAAADRRRIALSLTKQGAATFVEARRAIKHHEDWLRARFTPQEAAQLRALLARICE